MSRDNIRYTIHARSLAGNRKLATLYPPHVYINVTLLHCLAIAVYNICGRDAMRVVSTCMAGCGVPPMALSMYYYYYIVYVLSIHMYILYIIIYVLYIYYTQSVYRRPPVKLPYNV